MQSARYGRMNKPNSECAISSTSSGCFADVLTQVRIVQNLPKRSSSHKKMLILQKNVLILQKLHRLININSLTIEMLLQLERTFHNACVYSID